MNMTWPITRWDTKNIIIQSSIQDKKSGAGEMTWWLRAVYRSCWGPAFGSQHQYEWLQLPRTPVLGDLIPLLPLGTSAFTHVHTSVHAHIHTHTNQNKYLRGNVDPPWENVKSLAGRAVIRRKDNQGPGRCSAGKHGFSGRNHKVKENRARQVGLWPAHASHGMCAPTTITHRMNLRQNVLKKETCIVMPGS